MLTQILRGALLLAAIAAAPSAFAQAVQCTEGTGTSIAGTVVAIDLASGNVVFPTATVSCGQAQPALSATITSPATGTSVFVGSSINFQWTIGNFVPGTDSCSMVTEPNLPGTSWNLASVTPSSPAQPYSVSIPAGAAPGAYAFKLLCNRNGALAASSEVSLNVQLAPTCQDGNPPLAGFELLAPRVWDTPISAGGWGAPFGPGSPGTLQIPLITRPTGQVQVVSWLLTTPPVLDGYTFGRIAGNPDNGSPFLFFSKCPADVSWSASRVGCSKQGQNLLWKYAGFNPQTDRCVLQPGETYYYNVAFIDGNIAQTTGQVVDVCGLGSTCEYRASHAALSDEPAPTE
jgi:hypothetical protein